MNNDVSAFQLENRARMEADAQAAHEAGDVDLERSIRALMDSLAATPKDR